MKRASNDWKCPRFRLPIIGILLLPVLAPDGFAATVDVTAAHAWLDVRFEGLLADTSTPARVLSATAEALNELPKRQRVRDVLRARQHRDGTWTRSGEASALADQAFALMALATKPQSPAIEQGVRALLAAQGRDGGWTPTLSRNGFEDTMSTALAIHALAAVAPDGYAVERRRAREAVRTRQDPDSGLIGDESSGLGHWGATTAGAWILVNGGDARDLALRRALLALQNLDGRSRPARQPFYGLFFMPQTPINAHLRADLLGDIAAHQSNDGHWPVSRLQNDADEPMTTALLIIAARRLAQQAPEPATAPRLSWRAMPGKSWLLVTLPAEPADLSMIGPAPDGDALIVGYDACAVEAALWPRSKDADGRWHPWAEALASSLRELRAGPVLPDAIAHHVAGTNAPETLLKPEDFLAALDGLDGDAEKKLARQIATMPVNELFSKMRDAWAHEDDAALARGVAVATPAVLHPCVGELRSRAAKRLLARLEQGSCRVLMEAWLALGDDGVLARVQAAARERPR